MGLSPKSTQIALSALKEIAPELPIVYATRRQQDSLNKMSEVIVVKDEYLGNSEAVLIKTLCPENYKKSFEKIKKSIGNTSFSYKPENEYNELVEGIYHLGWS